MSRWKLFSRSKKDDLIKEKEKLKNEIKEETQKQETDRAFKYFQEEPLAEYSETLYSGTLERKKIITKPSTYQRISVDEDLIEEKIDNLDIAQAKKDKSNIEKRVDDIISGIDLKKSETRKIVPNIVYVLSKPQAGEVKGDWAVEINGEIYSHHKTKDNAIKVARKLAKKKKNGRIMIQNVDGTFDKTFKPK